MSLTTRIEARKREGVWRAGIAKAAIFAALLAPSGVLAQSPGITTRASVAADGSEPDASSSVPAISADGRFVAFGSWADDLVPGDTKGVADVFVRDRLAQTTERVSVDSTGLEANGASGEADVSADGRFVAFTSEASNLVDGDENGVSDVFVHDRVAHTTERVSVAFGGGDPDAFSLNPAISADGRWVAFESRGSNLTDDPNDDVGIHLFDRETDTTTRIVRSGADPDVSADGCVVVFASAATDLVDPSAFPPRERIYVRDCSTGDIDLISVRADGFPSGNRSYSPSISDDGRVIAFQSTETELVLGHLKVSFVRDVFAYDRDTGLMQLVSRDKHTQDCDPWMSGICFWDDSYGARISGDGRFISFTSLSPHLLPPVEPFGPQVFVYDRETGLLRRISVDPSGKNGSRCSDGAAISADGSAVAYGSTSDEIVPGDANHKRDILVSEWTCPPPPPDEVGDPLPQSCPVEFACPPTPATCGEAESSTFRLRRRPIGSDQVDRDELYWLWNGNVVADDLGDPRQGNGFHLCVYSPMYFFPADTIDHDAPIPGGADWRAIGQGYRLRGSGPGIDRVRLVAGANGSILARGGGADLALPYLPLGTEGEGPVLVRLHRDGSEACWGADYPESAIRENSAGLHRESGRDRSGRFLASVN